jgi:hypothetical protein
MMLLLTWFNMQAAFQRLLLKTQGLRATWEYPFAVAGVNISHMLIQLLELNSGIQFFPYG